MYSFRLDTMDLCEVLEISEMHGKCLSAMGGLLIGLCDSEQKANALISAMKRRSSYVADVDILLESVYSGLLADAFEMRSGIRSGSAV